MGRREVFGIIIGCSKCGTTSLYEYLTQHPEIASCREKEPRFFVEDERWEKGMGWYRSLWDEDAGPVLMEATTLYTWVPIVPNAAKRIAQVDGNFRFIYIMRDPVERAESHLAYGATRGYPQPDDPTENEVVMSVSKYARQLEEYRERFGRDKIYTLTLESLRSNPQEELRSVCSFLGVDDEYEFSVTKKHNTTGGRVFGGAV